jgi:hypothetical protein
MMSLVAQMNGKTYKKQTVGVKSGTTSSTRNPSGLGIMSSRKVESISHTGLVVFYPTIPVGLPTIHAGSASQVEASSRWLMESTSVCMSLLIWQVLAAFILQ